MAGQHVNARLRETDEALLRLIHFPLAVTTNNPFSLPLPLFTLESKICASYGMGIASKGAISSSISSGEPCYPELYLKSLSHYAR